MNILISGSSGFVGSNLIPYLSSRHFSVTKINLRSEGDIKKSLNGAAVIHLAGKAHDTSNTSDAKEYFSTNTDLTIRLFNQFLKSDTRDFIYFSSVKAAADRVLDILTENVIPNPQTPYGQSKLKAEEYLLSQALPAGKRLFILRPCMIHGPGNKGNLNLLYKFVAKGIPYPLAAFENKRSFLSIDNLCFIIERLLTDANIPSGIYNLADDEALSTNDVVSLIAAVLNKRSKLWRISQSVLRNMAAIGDKIKLPLNSDRLKKLTESYVVSNLKIRQAIDVKQLPVSAKEGLIKTIRSFQIN